SCAFHPVRCEQNGNCEKIVSFAPQPDGWTFVELFYSGTNPDTNYAAVGFSHDELMGDDAVTHCSFNDPSRAGAFLSRNIGKHNKPLNLTEEHRANNVELLQSTHKDNSVYCKFRQKMVPSQAAQEAHVPDLNQSYYLLLAYGKTNNPAEVSIHSLDANSKDFPTFISTPVNVAALADVHSVVPVAKQKPNSKRLFVLLHGNFFVP
ncbi:unnamed protein product, partial [Gongylonema pulchrum]|uniref:DOMON domain-containing protein n=1 Tax=Gongylonema pulchrum TaxID=637853 RepID=A0A183ERP2_9BILA